MLQLMLAGHPEIATTSEPWIALHPLFGLKEQGIETSYDKGLARRALQEFLSQSGVDDSFYKEQISHFLYSLYTQATKYQQKSYFLDKTPRYYLIIPELMEMFPDAKFVFLLRHPVAVFNSIINTWVKHDYKALGSYKDDLLLAPKLIIDSYNRHPEKSCLVKYEDLVKTPETILQDICNHIGIPYCNNMVNYGKHLPHWKFGDKIGVFKHTRPAIDSLHAWETEFKTAQLNLLLHSYLDELGKETIEHMGYPFNEILIKIPKRAHYSDDKLVQWHDIKEYDHLTRERDSVRAQRDSLLAQRDILLTSSVWKIIDLFRKIHRFFLKIIQS